MIKSNVLKEVPYPDEFDDNDKLEYDNLYSMAKVLHKEIEEKEPFIIHTAIIGHIRAKKGMAEPFTNEELQAVKDSYVLKSKVFECKGDEDPYLYDKDKNPMFFPSKLIVSSDENNSPQLIIEESNVNIQSASL